ncbi:ABC transporter substrate-binding protein [Natronococcus sp. A-GB1]|uniref:ABC transporter substrate-binding protein n=1 Tax=Natronococcus sp. A-GB1 TaxID=3037648 RepID=UPI00241EA9F2|nr:ABC transporter substrate-binding protein [Natronococcus sp. A-GB1]MDG5761790.1 ABC transporter substrate-binding protein [Natronococcus sp. A-GB1]
MVDVSRRTLVKATAAGSVVSLAGCIGGAEEDEESLVIGLNADPTDEQWDDFGGVMGYFLDVTEPLVGASTEMETEPQLAESWEQLDETTWRFELRDVEFHNGEALTADDVVWTFRDVLDREAWTSDWLSLDADGMETPDDTTVVFENTEPMASFPGLINHDYFGIRNPNESGPDAGTGPFELSERGDGEVILEPFEDYRGDVPNAGVTFRYIQDPATRSLSLQNQEVDVIFNPPLNDVSELEESSETDIHTQLATSATLGAVNLYESPTDDETLRRALNYAVDQEEIVENIIDGVGVPARGPFSNAIPWVIHDDLPEYGPDHDRARELVEESDYGGEELVLMVDSAEDEHATIAEHLQSNFEDIGVTTSIRMVETGAFYDTFTDGEANLTIVAFGSNSVASDYLIRTMFHSQGSDNRQLYEAEGTGVYNPGSEIDEMIETGYHTFDEDERFEKYAEVQREIRQTGAVVPLFYNEDVLAYRSGVDGFEPHPIDKKYDWTAVTVGRLD